MPTDLLLAYIDPGAGSLIVQALLAGVLAIPYFLRTHIRALMSRIRNRAPKE